MMNSRRFIHGLLVAALGLPLIAATPATTQPAPRIAPLLQPFVDEHVLAGAVTLVANKDTILSLEAVGYADVAAKKPMRTDDLFWIASMSKPIAATAVMMLVDDGKLSLDDPVAKYLPAFGDVTVLDKKGGDTSPRKPKGPILVRHLLSLSAGMQFRSPMESGPLDVGTLAERVDSYAKMTLDFDPGTNYQYSNASINTAARIVEIVSGTPYEKVLDQRLFQPLGMTDTTFWPSGARLARLAKSYQGNKDKSDIEETPIDQLRYPLDDRARGPIPAGGLFSTATDVARFARMMLNRGTIGGNRYLSESSVEQMTRKQTPAATTQPYGFGFRTNDTTFGHFGKYGTNLSIDFKRGLITVFMVQNAGWRDPDEGKKIHPTFAKAAAELIAKSR